MRVPGFGPEARAWQARVLPGYTTPARALYTLRGIYSLRFAISEINIIIQLL